MRILLNMPSQFRRKPSGVARTAFCLIERLIESTSHDYILRSPWQREDLPEALRTSRLSVITAPRPKFIVFDVVRQMFVVPFICRARGVDLVFNLDPFGSPTGGKARVTIVHDLYFRTIPKQIGWRATLTTDFIFRLVVAGSRSIVCVSDATRQDFRKWYPLNASRSLTIHSDSTLSVSPDEIGHTAPVAGRYILAVGNATSNKNFKTLAQAFEVLQQSYHDLHLVHVGSDPNDEILTTLASEVARNAVVRMNGIDDTQLATLYRHAACLCVPSLYEGFCLPVLEAQGLGCPVVCADRSATPEIAGDGALTFDPTRVSSLTQALNKLLSSPEVAEDLRKRGHENRQRYSWKLTAQKYAKLFDALVP
jgi:glycosyltransferase involved in cell wall biosynthesis